MRKTLDRQKPYGTVHGDEEGRVYVQDGTYFDSAGDECLPLIDDAPVDEAAKAKKK